ALASASASAQTKSKPVSGQYEREFVLHRAKPIPIRSSLFSVAGFGRPAKAKSNTVPTAVSTTLLQSDQMGLLDAPSTGVSWPQWGHDASHSGSIKVVGQSPNQVLADIIYDPFVEQEKASGERVFGEADLFVHYQT